MEIPTDETAGLMQDRAEALGGLLNRQAPTAEGKVSWCDITVGGEQRRFHMKFNGLVAVEKANGAPTGPMEVYRRLLDGKAPAEVVRTIILEGLRGGGEAHPGPVVDQIFADYPYAFAVTVAETVLAAALVGVAPATEA